MKRNVKITTSVLKSSLPNDMTLTYYRQRLLFQLIIIVEKIFIHAVSTLPVTEN